MDENLTASGQLRREEVFDENRLFIFYLCYGKIWEQKTELPAAPICDLGAAGI